jgi:hypothetical protein
MELELECPHCKQLFVVNTNEINCGIFRHAVYKNNMNPINPHETEANCNQLVRDELVFGCAKPFKISNKIPGKYTIEICDYV